MTWPAGLLFVTAKKQLGLNPLPPIMKETIEMKDLSGPTVLLDPDRNERNN